ncbi:hypothetical protein C0Q70_18205 [Pomacea canaliculata]|uniref:G-protein coupled receptors family 1 profile domain-containing protein n=1 Tax=Pomacea canaliculata TaxID=400727 RepID=A0A2T7NMK5_POMCA|nr:hypothetical protein C0Q70_18205 [Pomacea canaliculata]
MPSLSEKGSASKHAEEDEDEEEDDDEDEDCSTRTVLKDLYLLYDITTNTHNSTDNSNVDFPEGCIPVITTDHPEDPITHATEQLIAKVRGVSLMPVLFVFGVAGTCTSIASFYKQGLNHRINLCLFSLETVNFINVAYLFLLNVDSLYRPIDDGLYGVVFAHIVNSKMLGMLGFMYGTMYLSALVAWERCLTVLFPLHSKSLLSIRTMAILILLGSVITILPFFFVAAWYEAVCFYDLVNKRSTIGVSINEIQDDPLPFPERMRRKARARSLHERQAVNRWKSRDAQTV